ncbi:MAG: DUF1016 N-terminal domain-containing protein [Eubacteriales bacterium]|nr:DUF1016 N-terminal domain-containing protein [Eubacteriales bacterium]
MTEEYAAWLSEIKKKIKQSQIKASVRVNDTLLELYWNIGRDIVEKQETAKWGDSFLAVMSKDLQKAFPGMTGFSAENLKHIRYWYKFYTANINGLQPVTQIEKVKQMIKSIPWGHNQRIMYKCKDVNEALFYVQKTMDHGWSRSVLEHQIDSNLYERQGKAITNFQVKLPEPQSDLANQLQRCCGRNSKAACRQLRKSRTSCPSNGHASLRKALQARQSIAPPGSTSFHSFSRFP